MEKYGIPKKIVDLIKLFYRDNECTVAVEEDNTEMIKVKSGVRQGCNMSATLFIVALDWVMRKVVKGGRRGITWRLMEQLDDADFADDLCLMSYRHRDAEEKIERVASMGEKIGLKINEDKTKSMMINKNRRLMNLRGYDIKCVERFQYLGMMEDRMKI